jgi:hypothetical protein
MCNPKRRPVPHSRDISRFMMMMMKHNVYKGIDLLRMIVTFVTYSYCNLYQVIMKSLVSRKGTYLKIVYKLEELR